MILAEKPAGKLPLERLSVVRGGNTKMDFQDVGWGHGLD